MALNKNLTGKSGAYKYTPWTPSDEYKTLEGEANKYAGGYKADPNGNAASLLEKKNTYEVEGNPGTWDTEVEYAPVKGAYDEWKGRGAFSYDLNGDALYQQYKDKYINQGRLAMADTMGQASAMTGGYGSSYAVTAGNQAYQSHLQNLNDIVPQLYQMAYDRYVQEGEDLKTNYSMLSDMYDTRYGEYMDKVSIYNTTLDRLATEYNNERNFEYGTWNDDRTYYQTALQNAYSREYGQHMDEQNRLYTEYRDSVADEQWKKTYDLQMAAAQSQEYEGISFSDAEKLKAYADVEDWDTINNFIASLDKSDEGKKRLAEIWLPKSYLNALEGIKPQGNGGGGGGAGKAYYVLN